jgi:hypothetical protein
MPATKSKISVWLPKWPGIIVEGKNVDAKLAAEILIRTDGYLPDFSYCGNDRQHARELNALFGIEPPDAVTSNTHENYWKARDFLAKTLGKIDLSYFDNHQIVSSWIGGPHGWISWNGQVGCNTYNVGKHPSCDELIEDWKKIAKAFPTLDLTCWVHDKEIGEEGAKPALRIRVKGGKAKAFVQQEGDPMPGLSPSSDTVHTFIANFTTNLRREQGITTAELKTKLNLVYNNAIPQFKL